MDDINEENLRGSLESAFESAEAEAPVIEEKPIEAVEKTERVRASDGKFAKVDEAPAVEAKEGAPIVPDELIPDPVAPPVAEGKRAPSSWKKGAADKFATLEPDVQDEILRRETDFHKGIESFKTHADFGKRIEQTLAPFNENFAKAGIDSLTAVSELMKTEDILRNAPATVKLQKMLQLAAHYGIDLNQQVDPRVAEYEVRLHTLQQQNQEILRSNQSRETEAVNTVLGDFAQQPGHEHFDTVRNHMAALLQEGLADNLQDAYDQAVYANPNTRTGLLEQNQRKVQEEFNAKRAKAASVSVKGSSPSSGSANQPKNTLRAAIAAQFQ